MLLKDLDERAQLLDAISSTRTGVKDLISVLNWRPSRVIALLQLMHQERLVDFQSAPSEKRGRPKKILFATPLGLEFLQVYRDLQTKPLRARREDLIHAAEDAQYVQRLLEYGHSPFRLFTELNTIVNNIKISSEASAALRK